MTGPLAPEILERLERRLSEIRRPSSVTELAESLLQASMALRGSPRPPYDLAEVATARGLALMHEIRQRDQLTPLPAPQRHAAATAPEFERTDDHAHRS